MSALRATSPRFSYGGSSWEKGKNANQQLDELPGPGSYENIKTAFNRQSFRRGGTTFGDKKRFLLDKQWTDAGPGAYRNQIERKIGKFSVILKGAE